MAKKKTEEKKRPRGRPETRVVPRIDATPEELARALCRNADRKLAQKLRIKK